MLISGFCNMPNVSEENVQEVLIDISLIVPSIQLTYKLLLNLTRIRIPTLTKTSLIITTTSMRYLIHFFIVSGFPQRLLVALSVLVILVMFVMPVEARSIEHKRRHQRRQPEAMAQLTKDMRPTRHPTVELYKNATRKIMRKLKNTRRFFNQDRKDLNESKEYRDGMPDWLPAVNFVDIHFHDYKSSRKTGGSIWEKKVNFFC